MQKQDIQLIAFDLDGTIYNGKQIIEGALNAISFFRKIEKKICFFTNNSGQSRKQIFNKLIEFKIDLIESEVYCCSYAALLYFRSEQFSNLHVIGSENLKNDLINSGFKVNNQVNNIDAILIGMDLDFNYLKLSIAYEIVQNNKNCKIIICNADNNFPVEGGIRKPGCGPIVAAFLNACDRNYDFMLGKPNTYILDTISKELEIKAENILVVGDSYHSDIHMAQVYGAKSVLINEYKDEVIQNTIVIDQISDLKMAYLKNFK
jgi:HAD superfamily hydrolase (TIGR01450 family)